jgi:hypothetical protein
MPAQTGDPVQEKPNLLKGKIEIEDRRRRPAVSGGGGV